MSETPVPIPSGSVPAGAPAWLSADTEPWARLRPGAWARPKWSVLALILTVVWAIAVEPEPPCSAVAPCGPDWEGMIQTGLALGLLLWLAKLPEVVLVTAPALAVIVAWVELPGAGWVSRAANIAVIAALAFGWAAARARLAVRRRQRRLAERSSGRPYRLPEPVGPLVRGTVPLVAALVLGVAAAGFVAMGLSGIHEDEDHAARAVRVTARVIGHGDESLRLRTADARHITVGSAYPEDYGTGSTMIVLEDGTWRRLAAEPYDAFGWQVLTLAAVLPGLSLLTAGALARRRAGALRRAPVPVLRVLECSVRDFGTWVYAADDTAGRTPLLECQCVPVLADAEPSGGVDLEVVDDEEFLVEDERLREAVMFGAPYEGGELVLVTTDEEAKPLVIRTIAPVRLPRPDGDPVSKAAAIRRASSDRAESRLRDRTDRADGVAGTLDPTGLPMHWGPGAAARTVGLMFTAGAAAGVWFFVRLLSTEGFSWSLPPLLGLLSLTGPAATLLNWRATADSRGLWLAGAWKVRHVPWERLRSVAYTDEGNVEIRLSDGTVWQLTVLGWPAGERRLRIRPSYLRMAEEVAALHSHPELRPAVPSRPGDHGRPLAPFLFVLLGLTALAAMWA
ncbi:hypothetical protein [Streptomyces sp. NPDC008092]|uniref:hypothetical protein n=1 Tax=Streptomyces sp. NPDC008092 TaxID=3364808 RepID=UPI0036EF14C5